jgi:tetratricopeptide (TPR) repeat protein
MRAFAITLLLLAILTFGPDEAARAGLEDDGRMGSVSDVQGQAFVRPVGRDRWSPLGSRSLLFAGDLLRTPARGAHAVSVHLRGGGDLVMGPGGLLEIFEPERVRLLRDVDSPGGLTERPNAAGIRLLRGEVEVSGTVRVTGPGKFAQTVSETTVLRVRDGKASVLEKAPRWLTGYRASTTDEWMGALVANVDGRDVPLSVGYHAVDVVIRDQIAVTTVEQSFVNRTGSRLEGIFTFPLPADASISGFGMWIGDELVEADIVEKQRAREIFEDILRRRKDPGLLEWSGGNLFKARVFPIPAHGEKRIRLRYTQVLPLEGATFRYRYALRSELLRARPVRSLKVKVSVHSTIGLEKIASATHEGRIRRTVNTGTFEYDAEECSPDRDLEVAVTLARGAPLTVLPHRRGEDGYFALLLSPPDPASGAWKRDLIPEGDPLDVILLTDTSGSMDEAQRAAQADFVQGLLLLLGENDTFRLLAADVGVHAYRNKPVPATEEHVEGALAFLAARDSMGWSDLDAAVAAALGAAGQDTHVIYVGDGIGTTNDADPAALANRLKRLGKDTKATCHAVSTGSAYERVVLETIASLGGGSVRAADDDPAGCARRLLSEVAQPAVKDLAVSFAGIRTARVYPGTLPNLPAGRQQVILGRFLPSGTTQKGAVTVTGTLAGKPVRYEAPFVMAEDETGNSFLPRLWARRHLDALLAQGSGPGIQAEIVAFSEKFGILTPYTSFLVLENDEDRERYGVGRRVKMRDGERFFADAKDAVRADVLREQMRLAHDWRVKMRRRMLREVARLGLDLHPGSLGGYRGGYAYGDISGDGYFGMSETGGSGGGSRSPRSSPGKKSFVGEDVPTSELKSESLDADYEEESEPLDAGYKRRGGSYSGPAGEVSPYMRKPPPPMGGAWSRDSVERFANGKDFRASSGRSYRSHMSRPQSVGFPNLAPPPKLPEPVPDPDWPAEILEIFARVDRRPTIDDLKTPIEVVTSWSTRHARRDVVTHWSESRTLLSRDERYVWTNGRNSQPSELWLVDGKRGSLACGLRLGRPRPATETDRTRWTAGAGFQSGRTAGTWKAHDAVIESREDDRVTICLTPRSSHPSRAVHVIDTKRNVLLERRHYNQGRIVSTSLHEKHIEICGAWTPTLIRQLNAEGRETSRTRITIREIAQDAFDAELKTAMAGHDDVIFLGPTDPSLKDARQAIHEKKGTFADHLVHALHLVARQLLPEALRALDTAGKTVEGKPGMAWVRATILSMSRDGERMTAVLTPLVAAVAAAEGPVAEFRARRILDHARGLLGAHETLALYDRMGRGDANVETANDDEVWWIVQKAHLLNRTGRAAESRALTLALVTARPGDIQAIQLFLGGHRQPHDQETVNRVLERALTHRDEWQTYEADNVFQTWTNHLRNMGRHADMLRVSRLWIAGAPTSEQAYHIYLASLRQVGKTNEANAWIAARLAETPESDQDQTGLARISAAARAAMGQHWYGSSAYDVSSDMQWDQSLADLALRLSRGDGRGQHLVRQILHGRTFRQTDACRELRDAMVRDLIADGAIASMSIARLGMYSNALEWTPLNMDEEIWRTAADALHTRLSTAESEPDRQALSHILIRLLDARKADAEIVDVLRQRVGQVADNARSQATAAFLNRLLRLAWTPEIEDEAFAMIFGLVPAGMEPRSGERTHANALRSLAGRLWEGRIVADRGPAAEREKLSRDDLNRRIAEARKTAGRALAARFATARENAPTEARHWLEIERLTFEARLAEDLDALEAETRELLLGLPDEPRDDLARILRGRCVALLTHAAAHRRAPEALSDRVLALIRERMAKEATLPDWRYSLFRLLIILDRPEEIETTLRAWIVPTELDSPWRLPLGYLLAETGRLREAAALFEMLAGRDALDEAGYAAMTNWYVSLGRREDAMRTRLRRYRLVPEHTLSRRIGQATRMRSGSRGREPSGEIDPDVLLMIRTLLSKASHVENHLHVVQSLYRHTKDFRVLASLADAVIGHTLERTHGALKRSWNMISGIHEEATCDSIAERLAERRMLDLDATDRRALLLLEAMVERRAAEVLDEPGPHAKKALEALKASFPTMWRAGERRLLAELLASLGRIPDERLAAERISQIERIHRFEERGSPDRLPIAIALAGTYWVHERHDAAIDVLTDALAEVRESCDGALPPSARPWAARLVDYLQQREQFARAEAYVFAERDRQAETDEKLAYTRLLLPLYVNCLREGGTVSLGSGEALYSGAREVIEEALIGDHPAHLAQAIEQYCRLHETAARVVKIVSAGEDLERFSKEPFVDALARMTADRHQSVLRVATALAKIRYPLSGLTLLVTRLEFLREARTVRLASWNAWCRSMAIWRHETKDLGELESRLLVVVLRELEHDLVSLRRHSRHIYAPGSQHFFWSEKAGIFLAVARRVIEMHAAWPNRVQAAAEYIWGPLNRHEEAVGVLTAADARGRLTAPGRSVLAGWFLELKRYADALAHLEKLVVKDPDQIMHRTRMMTALHALKRPEEAGVVSDETHEHLLAKKLWNEHAGRTLAKSCLGCGLLKRSVVLNEEAIRTYERQRRGTRRTGNDYWLGNAYGDLARALAGLGKFDEAIDAASAAVVASGRTQVLRQTLKAIDDMDAYVARWDAHVAESGLDSAAIRGAIGMAYMDRKNPALAVPQLEAACLLRSEDAQTHVQLIRALDKLKDAEAACRAVARAIRQAPGRIDRYLDLARRLEKLGRKDEAERALTGLVEEKPTEADGHRRLGRHLMKLRRHDEAIIQFEQVARIRSLEPDGWLDLADALIKAKRMDEARRILEHVLKTKWDRRFRKVMEKTSRILRRIPDDK